MFGVSLNAMQVVLAVVQPLNIVPLDNQSPWLIFAQVARAFSICTLVSVAIVGVILGSALFVLSGREIVYAVKDLHFKKRRLRQDVDK